MSGKGRRPQALKLSGARGLAAPLTTAGPQNNPVEIRVVGTATPTKELLSRWTETGHVSPCQLLCLVLKPDFLPPQDMQGERRKGQGWARGRAGLYAFSYFLSPLALQK